MAKTKIEWVEYSINPIRVKGGGWHCTKVSPGCANCFGEPINMRFGNKIPYDDRPVEFELDLSCFDKLPEKKPAMVFVQSMGDLFHERLDYANLHSVLWRIKNAKQHKFLILTKRINQAETILKYAEGWTGDREPLWPLPNCWLGVTAENQEQADKRIPILLQIPAAVRFVSIEPMLGAVDISRYLYSIEAVDKSKPANVEQHYKRALNWVILGAESGQRVRYCSPCDMINVVNQCDSAGIPVFVKQIHDIETEKLVKDINQFPLELQIRQYPEARRMSE